MMSARIAPGRNRDFQFMRWPDFDAREWERVLEAADRGIRAESVPFITGSDRSTAALMAAADNAAKAGVANLVRLEKTDALAAHTGANAAWIVTNPSYGVRLGDTAESRRPMAQFGDHLRRRFEGWKVALLAPAQLERVLGMPLDTLLRTTNGGLRVQVLAGIVQAQGTHVTTRRPGRA